MRAVVHDRFGSPERAVEVRELEKPEPGPDEVLVRVRAASVNIAEWYAVTGRPWIARPPVRRVPAPSPADPGLGPLRRSGRGGRRTG